MLTLWVIRFVTLWSLFVLLVLLLLLGSPVRGEVGLNAFTIVEVTGKNTEKLRKAPEGTIFRVSPYTVQLSADWTLVEKTPLGADGSGELLHCRLPHLHSTAEVARRESHFVKRHTSRMRETVWDALRRRTSRSTGCMYGDGEGTLTGVPEWYLVCPLGPIRKVNKTAVATLYDMPIGTRGNATAALRQRIELLLRNSDDKTHRRTAWMSVIGEYRERITQPRWNAKRRSWELIYPSRRVCHAQHDLYPSISNDLGKVNVWTTVIRMQCGRRRRGKRGGQWSVTEIRRTCLHEILLASPEICDWEKEMDNIRTNPILCISV